MNQRVETGHQRLRRNEGELDSDWPAQWPERIQVCTPLPARPSANAHVEPAPPTSARTVLTALQPGQTRTLTDLLAHTRLPARTLRHAVRWLESKGKVERLSLLGDARRGLVRLRGPGTNLRAHNYATVRVEGLAGGAAV